MKGRLALATVPLQDGRAAAAEVEWAVGQGFRGIEIATNARGHEVSDPDLEPFWDACAETRVPVFLHPAYTVATPRVAAYYLRADNRRVTPPSRRAAPRDHRY